MKLHSLVALAASLGCYSTAAAASLAKRQNNNHTKCNYLPEDPEWPSDEQWAALNDEVGGRLIRNVPLPEVCYSSGFDSPDCTRLRNQWIYTDPHFPDPASIMSLYFQNNSCSPFPPANNSSSGSTCTLGNLATYSINITTPADATAGLAFARAHNIRLAIKNTGHDYLGRNTGHGTLSLWTHNLKETTFIQSYTSPSYTGPAMRLGAGVQGWEASAAAGARGYRVVAGYCPTVGTAGGYGQGGGFSPLSSLVGLASDSALAFEVVTADGVLRTVDETRYPDLFWALRGGGGGTFAVVLALTTRAYRDGPVAGAEMRLDYASPSTSSSSSADADNANNEEEEKEEAFFGPNGILAAWHAHHAYLNRQPGLQTAWAVTNTTFTIARQTWPGHTAADLRAAMSPFLAHLDALGLSHSYEYTPRDDPSYEAHFAAFQADMPVGDYRVNDVIQSRFIPAAVLEDEDGDGGGRNGVLMGHVRDLVRGGRFSVSGVQMNVSHARVGGEVGGTAAMPAWRDAAVYMFAAAVADPRGGVGSWRALFRDMNEVVLPRWRELTPGGGGYMNEATFDNPYWKEDYFGVNYERLLEVKRAYDPDMLLYSRPSVGHEFFEQRDGRICKL